MHYNKVAVGAATAVAVTAQDADGGHVWLRNDGAVAVFVGGSDVAADGSKGYKIAAGTQVGPITLQPGEGPLYAIAASGTADVYPLQTGEHS